jgi:hypothetical protein
MRRLCLLALLALPAAASAAPGATPDFTGIWGRNAFNFEPVVGGPAPLINLARLPDGTGDAGQLVGDYNNPILKAEAAAIVKKLGEVSKTGRAYPDPSNSCGPYAPPFTYAMQLAVQILPANDHLTFIYNQDDQVRRVRLNASHPRDLKPSPMGDSVGHYEGDTLIVDTVGVKALPYAMTDRFGVPVTNTLHVIERYRLIDGAAAKQAQETYEKREGRVGGGPGAMAIDPDTGRKGLQITVTVEDPAMYTTPWTGTATYRPTRTPWLEQVCAENPGEYYEGQQTMVPKAAKPDF